MTSKNITIAGSGLVGSLLSIYMAKKGHKVDIYERRQDARKTNIYAGKSINLALSDRGWRALEKIGIAEDIKKIAIPMYGRFIHPQKGENYFQPYGKDGQAIYSVSRGELNCRLMDLAEKQGNVKIQFSEQISSVDLRNNEVTTTEFDTQINHKHTPDLIFGADGAFANTRLQFQLQTDRFDYRQDYMEVGYKELNIPAGPNGSFLIEKNALHIWPRGNYMLIALPNMDGSFTCTLFFPHEGYPSFDALKTKDDVKKFFEEVFPDAVPLMPTYLDDYFTNPSSSLCIVRCKPWIYKDKLALIGDAAHAIVPFYGQGMNCGFEDVFVLDGLMEKHGDNWNAVLEEYQLLRKPDGDAIAQLAKDNFKEMSEKTADPKFILRKKIEAKFADKYPEKWTTLYSMVTFSPHIRYSEAYSKGLEQDAIMEKIMSMPNIEQNWDSQEVMDALLKLV